MIVVDDLSVRFGSVMAISNLSVEFPDSITGVIGPNGAGKTTLLDAIAGAVPATGSVTLDGYELTADSAHQRARHGVRRSFQSSLLVDELTVLDNVRLGLDATRARTSTADAECVGALAALGIARLASTSAGRLVNFERRLVGLARCIVARPKLLLLDEPGAGLISHEKSQLAEMIRLLATDFAESTLLIEHDMEFVSETCPSVVVLNCGTLLAAGPTSEVLKDANVRSAYLGEEF